MAFGGSNYWNSNDLYEWDGVRWNLVPASVKPPRPGDGNASQVWLNCAYDERRDKIALFGSAWYDWNNLQLSNMQPETWEWDTNGGWTPRAVQATVDYGMRMYFDSQRGVMTKIQGSPIAVAEWDGSAAWNPIAALGAPGTGLYANKYGAYDSARGILFLGVSSISVDIPFTYGTRNPPAFDTVAPGCSGTLGEPTLRLSRNWTRAWMGRSLSVDLVNLPQSAGFIVVGWSHLQAGAYQLPLDLTPYGMPGCHARVATDLIVPVTGQNQAATLVMPVPQNHALLGITLYQQGFALDPTANAAGLTAGNAVRITVGRL